MALVEGNRVIGFTYPSTAGIFDEPFQIMMCGSLLCEVADVDQISSSVTVGRRIGRSSYRNPTPESEKNVRNMSLFTGRSSRI